MAQSRPEPRQLEVIASRKVTPNMLRITLGGAGLDGFPADQAGGYVKLRLEQDGSAKPVVRTYTIRAQREGEIDVDFVLHGVESGDAGPATLWAVSAQPGDTILVGGPGPAKPLPANKDRYLVVGDMTAIPAICVNLEQLPANAKGMVVLEVQDEADVPDVDLPASMEMVPVVNTHPGIAESPLPEKVKSFDWGEGAVYAWSASEFSAMRALRDFFHGEKQLGRDELYISSYWKSGLNEDSHKVVKREDANESGFA
ncbi:siderophore-interacting protein [Altericroceibacterium endophyticum]|uniref:Siderophore-interacting protein n=1 Tax=Altericroceibacterium endophyticum TaxID=1808508 RepID=A0A6I4T5I6_9SPHN|nr:siderophore-interacting protein [Altericroceibacterium endophyticum]MXO65411.1 siderophore-interacting protein [Altericroceibacterium endophyticum]